MRCCKGLGFQIMIVPAVAVMCADEAELHVFLQAVERKTLARQCPTLLTLLKSFPKTIELQEPTFKDIVVVYR